ncbi:MAG: potassium channel family protein [Flavobacteriales bacterium]
MRTFQTEVENIACTCGDFIASKTVLVKVFDKQKLIAKHHFGIINMDEVYQKIVNQQPINISNGYIRNFSLIHLKKQHNIDLSTKVEIKNMIAKNCFFESEELTDFSHSSFSGGVDFSKSIFASGDVSFHNAKFLEGNTKFKEVFFNSDSVSFQYAKFEKGDVIFQNTVFNSNSTSFVNSSFGEGNVSFKNVDFSESKVNFHFAKFGKGDKIFDNSIFGSQGCDFRKVEFNSGKLEFKKVHFGDGEITFDESELLDGRVNFRYAIFGNSNKSFRNVDFGKSDVNFDFANFESGALSFSQSKVRSISFKGAHLNLYIELKVALCETIDFTDSVLRGIIDMQPSSVAVTISKLHLVGLRNLGRIIIDWKFNHVKQLIKNQPNTTLLQKSAQFNILKENFHSNGQYEDEDSAYIQFKRFEHRAELERVYEKGGKYYLKLPYLFFKWVVFDKMGVYATNPLRVLFSMLVIYCLFSVLYFIIGIMGGGSIINAVGADDQLSFLQSCFYHSAITFLTIGYGDFYPTGLERGLSIIEGWSGVFLMSYFTVAFVRKILR